MKRVDRPPIKPNIWSIAVQLHKTFAAIVTGLAQALQFPEKEHVRIAAMRLDVICDRRRHDRAATREAELAQRMFAQLMLA